MGYIPVKSPAFTLILKCLTVWMLNLKRLPPVHRLDPHGMYKATYPPTKLLMQNLPWLKEIQGQR